MAYMTGFGQGQEFTSAREFPRLNDCNYFIFNHLRR
jgi:hypothetical protein